MRKFLFVILAAMICIIPAFARPVQDQSVGEIVVTIPHYRSGENIGAVFFLPQVERFNQKYAGQYRLIIEELVQDLYIPRMQLLSQLGRLPALVDSGSKEWIEEFIIPYNQFVDLSALRAGNADIRAFMPQQSVDFNTHNGRLVSISFPVVRPIGAFYNPAIFQPSRPFSQMTWAEVAAELGDNRIAFMTAENAWTTMLTLSSLVAAEPGGAEWLAAGANENPKHIDFNNPIMINAVTKLQQLLQNHASANTLGAAYADAANSFMSNRSAVIANGSWMVGDFAPANSANWSSGFNGNTVRGDVLPGNVVIGGPAVGYGWWIPSTATPREQELAKAFIEFIYSQEELEAFMLAEGGSVPGLTPSQNFVNASAQRGLLAQYESASNADTILAYNLGDVIPNSVFQQDFGRLLPLLIDGTYTPERFCQELSIRAVEAMR